MSKTNKKKPSRMQQVKRDIKSAFDFQDKDSWKEKVLVYQDYYKGKYYSEQIQSRKYVINTIFNFVNLIVPTLFFQDPHIRVKPRRKNIIKERPDGTIEAIPAWRVANLMESIINKILQDIQFEHEVRKCVQDAIIFGYGVLKVGYALETEQPPNNETPEAESETPRIKEEGVFAARINPLDFGFDPTAASMQDARYVVHRSVRPLEEVKNNDLYSNTDSLPEEVPQDLTQRKNRKRDEYDGFTTIYEYHDLMENEILTVAKDGKKFLRKRKNPHEFPGSHFIVLKLAGNNDDFRGISFIEMIEDQAIAWNETFTKMIKHLDMFPGQILYEQGSMEDDEVDLLKNGEQGSIIGVQNGALTEGRVQKLPPLPMGADYFNVQNLLQQTMDLTLGIQDFQRTGIGGESRKTATEATFEQADSSIRRQYFLNFVKDFIVQAVSKIAGMLQQYYDQKQIIRLEGDYGFEFVEWTNEDIAGEFDFDFDIQSMQFFSQSKAQQIINALNVLASHPATQPIIQQIDPLKIAKELFKHLDLNFEEIKKQPSMAHLEFNPDLENELILQGKSILDPKPGDPHEDHIAKHMIVYEQTQSPELLRHIQMHQFLMKVQSGEINMQQLLQQAGNNPLQGSVPQAAAQPAPTEPELQGNFFSSLRGLQ